jgi:hypothetical protein
MSRLLSIALATAALSGCDTGAAGNEMIVLTAADLPPSANLDLDSGTWQSVGFADGDAWHAYPGGAVLSIEHGLPRAPRVVLVYISFESDGSPSNLASGDLAQIEGADETRVVVHNRTDADLYCRVVLE